MVGLICGSKTFGDDSKTTLGMPFWRKILVNGGGYASNKKGDNVTLQKWSVLSTKTRVGYTTLKSMDWRACNIKCQHVCGSNNRTLHVSGIFYSNFIILSSLFRPLDHIYAFANEYLNSNLRYNRCFWNIFNIWFDAINWTSLFNNV